MILQPPGTSAGGLQESVLALEMDAGAVAHFEAVHAQTLRFFPDLVRAFGGDPAGLMRQVGIAPDQIDAGSVRATYRQTISLIALAAETLDRPDFGMQLALRQRGGDMFGPLGAAMKTCPTFGEAIDYARHHSYAHSPAASLWLRRFPSAGHVFVGHDILLDRLPYRNQMMEQMLLLGHLAAMELTGGRARARRVHFRHQPLSALPIYRRHFGCPVYFGQNEDGISFSDQDMACPLVGANADALERITALIDRDFARHRSPLHARVRGVIMQQIGTGRCSNDQVAAALTLHPRTLHRRLTAEATSFQKIKDEVRRDILLYYLQQTDLGFSVISEKLGYSEQSVMTRSCNLWFSASPTQLRAMPPAFA